MAIHRSTKPEYNYHELFHGFIYVYLSIFSCLSVFLLLFLLARQASGRREGRLAEIPSKN